MIASAILEFVCKNVYIFSVIFTKLVSLFLTLSFMYNNKPNLGICNFHCKKSSAAKKSFTLTFAHAIYSSW